jgi:MFS superfamily sulfate permease-like transporter
MQEVHSSLALAKAKFARSVREAKQSFAQTVQEVRTTPLSAYRTDIAAGLAVVGILVPEAVAYAGIAQMPPLAGLIALFFGLLAYMIIGTSPYAIVSATSSSAMVLAVAVSTLSTVQVNAHPETLAAVLVMMTGFWFILARVLNFGQAANFVAKPVLRGVTMGLSLTIIIMQLPKLLGMHILTRNPWERIMEIIQLIPSMNWVAAAVGLISLAVLFAWRWPRQPASLWVVVASIIATYFLPLESLGVELVGNINLERSALSVESLYDADWLGAIQMSAALCLMVYAESYSSIHSTAARHGLHPNNNRDLVALGSANLLSGFFGGLSVGAGFSATSLNEQAGARTRLAGATALVLFVLIVIFLMPYISRIPEPVLGAIVIKAVSHGLSWRPLQPYFKWKRDRLLVVASFLAVAVLGVLNGLLVSVVLSVAFVLIDSAKVHVSELRKLNGSHSYVNVRLFNDTQPTEGVMIMRLDQPMFFANAEPSLRRVADMIAARQKQEHLHHVILSMEETPNVDGTSIESLIVLAKNLHDKGINLSLCRLHRRARIGLMNAASPYLMPSQLSYLSVDRAVKDALAKERPDQVRDTYTPGARRGL